MGIDPSSVNVMDLEILRPDRSGPGGDEVGPGTVLGSELQACRVAEDKLMRDSRGRELVSFARFFLDPWAGEDGEVVEIRPGDLASWSNVFGSAVDPQEIISVEPTMDCDGRLDIITFRVGRQTATGA